MDKERKMDRALNVLSLSSAPWCACLNDSNSALRNTTCIWKDYSTVCLALSPIDPKYSLYPPTLYRLCVQDKTMLSVELFFINTKHQTGLEVCIL